VTTSKAEPLRAGLQLRDIVSARRRQLPPKDVYPVAARRLVERRFFPSLLPQTETLFSTSNGYLGIRATPEEGSPIHEAGTYLNGFYETWPIAYAEEAYGFAKTGQSMLRVPDGTLLKLYVDDEPFELSRARLLSFERVLDFTEGTLDREVRFDTPDGKRIAVRSRRLASLEDRHLACIQFEVRVIRGHANLTISSELVTPGPRADFGEADPRRGDMADGCGLVATNRRAHDRRALLNLKACASGLRMACAMDHLLEADCPVEVEEADCSEDRGRVVFLAEATEGQRIQITKFLAYHHSDSADDGELRFRTNRTLDRAMRGGFEHVLAGHRRRVDSFWETSDVDIEGDPEVQQAVRFNLFQLLQASARVEGFGIPAKGLTALGYQGHYFWDTEIYVLPFLVYTAPHIARSLLDYRYSQLGRARRRAREVGQAGALFPWRTINGEEASAYYAAGTAQYHIDADIVFAADHYVALTGDLEFLGRGFTEMAVETARLWVDLGFYSKRKDGRFCINGVTGPDEYNTVVNNNAYTNLMARQSLLIAAGAVDLLRRRAPEAFSQMAEATRLDSGEPEKWRRAAELMYIPFDQEEGVHLQDDGFLDREIWDLDTIPPEKFPLLLHYHPLVIYRHQVIKQADLVLATFLLNDEFTEHEKRRIFDYYDPLTTGDSSLSACIESIMAFELGYHEKAYSYFADAVAMDLGDIGGNVKDGLHIASLAGTWLALVHGFAGLRDRGGRLSFRPRLPDDWTRLRFRLRVRDELLELDVRPGSVTYRLLNGTELEIQHEHESLRLVSDEPLTLETSTTADSRLGGRSGDGCP
jgi:alpha,alpha-trehalose phosphorylase